MRALQQTIRGTGQSRPVLQPDVQHARNPRKALAVDDFNALMLEWVEWIKSALAAGFQVDTTIYRAIMGSGHIEFQSKPPVGVHLLETRGALTRLIEAMDALLGDEETRTPVLCVQHLYINGAEAGMAWSGKSKTKFYEAIRTGEMLIRWEMKRA